jgi:ProP effector
MSTKQADARAAISLLAEKYPRTFFVHEAKRRPLKVGIHVDIIATVNGAIEPHELVAALRAYTSNAVYLTRLRPGATRIDLDGNPAGIVTAEAAAEKLATRMLKAAARKKLALPAPEPTPAGPKRLSRRDLKELASVRRRIHQ